MEIVLTEQCESFTGSLGRGFGYHIQRRKNGFFAKRNTKGDAPRNGHWLFIVACANLAQCKLHIADIRVKRDEMADALWEAGKWNAADYITANKEEFPAVFCMVDVLSFKKRWAL